MSEPPWHECQMAYTQGLVELEVTENPHSDGGILLSSLSILPSIQFFLHYQVKKKVCRKHLKFLLLHYVVIHQKIWVRIIPMEKYSLVWPATTCQKSHVVFLFYVMLLMSSPHKQMSDQFFIAVCCTVAHISWCCHAEKKYQSVQNTDTGKLYNKVNCFHMCMLWTRKHTVSSRFSKLPVRS